VDWQQPQHPGIPPPRSAPERHDDAGRLLHHRRGLLDDRESRRGHPRPDDLPHDYVLGIARTYLGKFISTPSDWTPLRDYTPAFKGAHKADMDFKDPWQFKNFLVKAGD
jgi:hypothetical protein